MDPAWIGFIGVLAGVVVTSIAEAFRTRASFKREKTWQIRDERRAYLEELWTKLDELKAGYDSLYLHAIRARSWESESLNPRPSRDVLPWARIQLLVAMYLPEYGRLLIPLVSAGGGLDDAIEQAEARGLGTFSQDAHERLMDASEGFEVAIEPIRKAITGETRAITDARYGSAAVPDAFRR